MDSFSDVEKSAHPRALIRFPKRLDRMESASYSQSIDETRKISVGVAILGELPLVVAAEFVYSYSQNNTR